MTDAKPIFISYARKESSVLVDALVTKLGTGRCFVDRSDIEVLAEFPKAIVEAMLGARVVLAILGPRYPKSWYCWREWLLALAPYEAELQRSARAGVRGTAAADARLDDASSPLVVALHPDAEAAAIGMIPPELSRSNLPKADEPSAVVEAVERVLARSGLSPKSGGASARVGKKAGKTAAGPTLGELYERFEVSTPTRDLLLDKNVLPSVPRRRGTVPAWPVVQHDHQGSLGDDFVGRAADFWRLHHALSLGMLDGAACITALLSGGGGYGKTRLALEYFHRMGPLHYPGGNFIVDAAGDAEGRDLNSQLGEIDRILREKAGTAGTAAPAEVRESLSRRLCDAATRGRVLYLVDNLPDTGNQGKIEDYCPAAKEVSLVFTSRREVRWSGVKPVSIETLARQESIRLLQRHLDRPKKLLTDPEWDSLAEAVGDLPLVLEILNATLREGLRTAKALHRSVVGGDAGALFDELAATLRGVVPEQSLRGISEAFRASLAGLVDPAARELLLRAAWLAPAPIPMELLTALAASGDARASVALLRKASWMSEAPAGEGTGVLGVADRAAMPHKIHRVVSSFLRAVQRRAASDRASDDAASPTAPPEGQRRIRSVGEAMGRHLSRLRDQGAELEELAVVQPHVWALTIYDAKFDDQDLWHLNWRNRDDWDETVSRRMTDLRRIFPTPEDLVRQRPWWSLIEGERLSALASQWVAAGIEAGRVRQGLLGYAGLRSDEVGIAGHALFAIEHLARTAGSRPVTPPFPPLPREDYDAFFSALGFPEPPAGPAAEFDVVLCPPPDMSAEFRMGSPARIGNEDERPPHPVCLTPFRLTRTPVTWRLWRRFSPQTDVPEGQTPDHPATMVDWWSAFLFCRWVGGDLPTEAQWEFACRAGTQSAYSFGDNEAQLPDHGWFYRNSGPRSLAPTVRWDLAKARGEWGLSTKPVGTKAPNPWGLRDVHGNVWEWCRDWYGPYVGSGEPATVIDPLGPERGRDRVLRGGSCRVDAVRCRSAARFWSGPGDRNDRIGFRVAFPAPPLSS